MKGRSLRQRRHSEGAGTAARLREEAAAYSARVATAEGDAQRLKGLFWPNTKSTCGDLEIGSTSMPCSRSTAT